MLALHSVPTSHFKQPARSLSDSICHSKISKVAFAVFKELVQVSASLALLIGLQLIFFKTAPISVIATVFFTVIVAPFTEEILFREFMQTGIRRLQNWYSQKQPSLRQQKAVRVFVTAACFALVHAANPHRLLSHKVMQVSSCFVAGITFGYLREKEQSLATPILYHGIHNLLCFIPIPIVQEIVLRATDIGALIYATKESAGEGS